MNSWSTSTARSGVRRTLCAVLLIFQPVPLATGGGHVYGEDLLRLDDTASDSPPLLAMDPAVAPQPLRLQDLQDRLRELEGNSGPYAPDLAEDLGDIAREYRAAGQLPEALQLYRRALHIVRVNDGLYSELQVPLVRAELDIYRANGDLEELDRRFDYYFRLFGSGRAPFSDLRLRATLGYLRWQREALRLDLDGRSQSRLLATVALNRRILEDVAADPSVPFALRTELAMSQLKNFYLVQERVDLREKDPYAYQQLGSLRDPAQWSPQDVERQRAEQLRRSALGDGAAMLEELIVAAGEGAAPLTLAGLYLALGDWYQWNDKTYLAADSYRKVRQQLEESGDAQQLSDWLGEPVELPANGVFRQLQVPGAQGEDDPPVVTLGFEVGADGRARDIELLAATAAGDGGIVRAKRALRKLRFRPRWIDGSAEAVTGLQREYVLPPR